MAMADALDLDGDLTPPSSLRFETFRKAPEPAPRRNP
jgi:hypothetical protein